MTRMVLIILRIENSLPTLVTIWLGHYGSYRVFTTRWVSRSLSSKLKSLNFWRPKFWGVILAYYSMLDMRWLTYVLWDKVILSDPLYYPSLDRRYLIKIPWTVGFSGNPAYYPTLDAMQLMDGYTSNLYYLGNPVCNQSWIYCSL